MNFDNDMFSTYLTVIAAGISAGFVLGFISWGIGYAIYGSYFKCNEDSLCYCPDGCYIYDYRICTLCAGYHWHSACRNNRH